MGMKLLAATLIFISFFSPSVAFAQSPSPSLEPIGPVSSFELFWPISAGKVAGEPLYFLKTLKENVRGMLIFSTYKKAEYAITLGEKRVVEAEKLFLEKKDYQNGAGTLQVLQEKWKSIDDNIQKLSEDPNIEALKDRFASSLDKQRTLLQYVASMVPTEAQTSINESLTKLNQTSEKVSQ
jgi:hypothetical protein